MKKGALEILRLFIVFFKIGLFTFGGGYAMIPLIQDNAVEKYKWLRPAEMMDLLVIAESTPGPIAINSATYIGFKVKGFFGALAATLGVILPSFIITFIISLFFVQLTNIEVINNALLGISSAVIVLVFAAVYKLIRSMKFDVYSVITAIVVAALTITFGALSIIFSSIYFILIGGFFGILFVLVSSFKARQGSKK